MKTICWTGGSRPNKPSKVTQAETSVRSYLFREQIEAFRKYWGDYPDRDTLRIYFRRARMDAHAHRARPHR